MKRREFSTQEQARGLKPEGRTYFAYDREGRHLAVRVTRRGVGTYVVVRRIGRRVVHHKIGRVDEMTLKAARDAADAFNGAIASRPSEFAASLPRRVTWGEFWVQVYDPYIEGHLSRPDAPRWLWRKHCQCLVKRPMVDTAAADISRLHLDIGRRAKRTANQVRTLLATMLKRAAAWGYVPRGHNPAAEVERFGDCEGRRSRRRVFVKPEKIEALRDAITKERPLYRDYFELLLATGQRKSAVMAMRWRDLDLANGRWTIPARSANQHTKNAEPTLVPLGAKAMEILTRRPRVDGEGNDLAWVFPSDGSSRSHHPSRPGHLTNVSKPWKRICARAGVKAGRDGYTIHDLRRTVGVYAAAKGMNQRTIQAMLGHHDVASTEVYTELGEQLAASVAAEGFRLVDNLIWNGGAKQLAAGTREEQ